IKNADGDVGGPRGWYSRGYLPHFDQPELIQSITFRLADSLPQKILARIRAELREIPAVRRKQEQRKKMEYWLDQGLGCCALGHPEVAEKVQESLLHFDGQRYRLLAWCVMPNHVHVLVECLAKLPIIIQGWKSFTAHRVLPKNGELQLGIPDPNQFWMREYWDRYTRDENHLAAVINYIHENPVKAGLCEKASDWPWSSASKKATSAD
ncbi:MAG: transposase, partial [Pirellulaceae bacterium]